MKIQKLHIGCLLTLMLAACQSDQPITSVNRLDTIPSDAVKITQDMDDHPPILHSDDFEQPIPLPGPVNSAGAEDSPFIPNDNPNDFYFFFTPDVRVAIEEQLLDGATGIYYTQQQG